MIKVTNEQVDSFIQIMKDAERHNVKACLDEFKKPGQHAIAPEVFIRTALEAYEQNKWVKFDVDNVSTWPPMPTQPYASVRVMVYCADTKETLYGSKLVTNLHRLLPTDKGFAHWIHPCDRDKHINVTHWQYLPEFKE